MAVLGSNTKLSALGVRIAHYFKLDLT